MDRKTVRAGKTGYAPLLVATLCAVNAWRRLYQPATCQSTAIASRAASENHATLPCPWGITIHAAMRGPIEAPILPPTWNIDCASPCRPPDARRATREDSGWKMDEPVPTSAAASRIVL